MAKITHKKSSVSGKVPLVADLDYGELALNYADGRLYYKTSSNTITHITANFEPLITTLAITKGGTGATTQQAAINALAGGVTAAQFLRGNGTNVVMSPIQASDIPTLNQNTTGTASNVTGTVAVANGGTGATTLTGVVIGNGTSAFTVKTNPTGAFVGTTDSQTLTNKTLGANISLGSLMNGLDNLVTQVMLRDTGWSYHDSGTTNALNFNNGSHQRWAPNTGAQTLSITNWPPSGNLGELLIEGVNLGAATITWPTVNWIKSDGTTTTLFSINGVTLQTSGTDWVFLWTRDAGTTIYGKVVR